MSCKIISADQRNMYYSIMLSSSQFSGAMAMANVLKFQNFLFLYSNKMCVIKAGIHKMLVRIANRKDPDLGLCCFFRPLCRQLVFEILEHLPYTSCCLYGKYHNLERKKYLLSEQYIHENMHKNNTRK